MQELNITTRNAHPTIKKSLKAIMGAMLVSERPLVPTTYHKKVYWTLDFLAPAPPVEVWDTSSPLVFRDDKVKELVEMGIVVVEGSGAYLTRGGSFITEDCQWDWMSYWNFHFSAHRTRDRPFNWTSYFKTGCADHPI